MVFFCFIVAHLFICFSPFQEHVCVMHVHVCLHVGIGVDEHVYRYSLCICVHA